MPSNVPDRKPSNIAPPPLPAARRIAALLLLALAAGGLATGCEHTGLMKTPNLYLAAESDPFAHLPEHDRRVEVDLIYATDRAENGIGDKPRGTGAQYGHKRSDELAFGVATVALGDNVTWEELRHASVNRRRQRRFVPFLAHTEEMGRFPPPHAGWRVRGGAPVRDEDHLREEAEAEAALSGIVADALARAERPEVFLFVHGYNNQFYHAAQTMAQVWHFMARPGVPMVYSWPAGRGGLRGYTADSESGSFTNFHFKQFLRAIAAAPGLEKIHILAHSRGTDVATTAIKELMLEYRGAGRDARAELKLGHLVLAAPDLDLDIVNHSLVAEGVIFVPERFTVYLSNGDRALLLSSWLTDSVKRLGRIILADLNPFEQAKLTSLPNVIFIDAEVESDITGHTYFWTNPAASSDIILLLRDGLEPGVDNGRPLIRQSNNFWLLRENYPGSGVAAGEPAGESAGESGD
ncbi:MAG: alpha/beta hydrolase [Candidatus Hydrogenedentes bacterium]|nr:alpha/beta hydrolase [Candidatus Hydrogenedentota bacterium]